MLIGSRLCYRTIRFTFCYLLYWRSQVSSDSFEPVGMSWAKTVLAIFLTASFALFIYFELFGNVDYFSSLVYDINLRDDWIYRTASDNVSVNMSVWAPAADWTVVPGRRLVLRSAYVDLSSSTEVKILANKHCKERGRVKCSFHSRYFQNYRSVLAKYDNINTEEEKDCNKDSYEAYFVVCRLPAAPSPVAIFRPTEVSISAIESSSQSAPHLNIVYVPPHRLQLSVCVSPLVNWNEPHQLVMFLEYYIYQGADYFLIYNRSTSNAVDAMLREYEMRGLVNVVKWPKMPLTMNETDDPNANIHYNSQILQMNDCLWRLRGRTRFAALVDLDEFIAPMSLNWSILQILQDLDRPSIGGFMFLSSFTYVDFPFTADLLTPAGFQESFNFSQLNVFRGKNVFSQGERSKMVVKPIAIEKQTVHLVWKYARGYSMTTVPQSTALLYHLRGLKAKNGKAVVSDNQFETLLQTIFRFSTGLNG